MNIEILVFGMVSQCNREVSRTADFSASVVPIEIRHLEIVKHEIGSRRDEHSELTQKTAGLASEVQNWTTPGTARIPGRIDAVVNGVLSISCSMASTEYPLKDTSRPGYSALKDEPISWPIAADIVAASSPSVGS